MLWGNLVTQGCNQSRSEVYANNLVAGGHRLRCTGEDRARILQSSVDTCKGSSSLRQDITDTS